MSTSPSLTLPASQPLLSSRSLSKLWWVTYWLIWTWCQADSFLLLLNKHAAASGTASHKYSVVGKRVDVDKRELGRPCRLHKFRDDLDGRQAGRHSTTRFELQGKWKVKLSELCFTPLGIGESERERVRLMLRRSMHAWRSTSWLLHTRAVLCCCCCKSCWCQSSLAPLTTFVTYFYFPAPPQSGPGAMLVDGVTTKPRLKQAGREGSTDDTPRVRGWQGAICSWQVAATHSHNLSGSLLATRFSFYFSPTYHTSAAAACIVDTEQPDLPLWKSTKPEAVPVHSRSRWTLRSKWTLE